VARRGQRAAGCGLWADLSGGPIALSGRAGAGRAGFIRGSGPSRSAFIVATAKLRHMTPAGPAGPAPRVGHANRPAVDGPGLKATLQGDDHAGEKRCMHEPALDRDRPAWPTRERARRACRRHVAQQSCRHDESRSGGATAADEPRTTRPCPTLKARSLPSDERREASPSPPRRNEQPPGIRGSRESGQLRVCLLPHRHAPARARRQTAS
jgi:hypothetical protein